MYGIGPAIIAIVLQALWKLGQSAVKGAFHAVLGITIAALVYTPTYASWLNRIEAIFTGVRYFALANSDYPDQEYSRRAILAYVAWRNRHRHTELVKRREKHKMSFATRH